MYGMPATAAVSLIAIGTPAKGRSSPGPIGVGGGEGAVGIEVHERVELGLQRLDALERRLGQLGRAELAAPNQSGELGGGPEERSASTGASLPDVQVTPA